MVRLAAGGWLDRPWVSVARPTIFTVIAERPEDSTADKRWPDAIINVVSISPLGYDATYTTGASAELTKNSVIHRLDYNDGR